MKWIAPFLLLPAVLFAADFPLEDFSGYDIGDDIGESADWDRDDEGEYFLVADDGGNHLLELDDYATGGLYAGYTCDGGGLIDDGLVSMDFRFSGDDCYMALTARAYDDEAYIGGLQILTPPYGFAFTAIINGGGDYTILSQDVIINAAADTWHTLALEAIGSDPVELTLSLNGSPVSSSSDDSYLYQTGWSGFGAAYEVDIDYIQADNFFIDDYTTAVEGASFGRIKALF